MVLSVVFVSVKYRVLGGTVLVTLVYFDIKEGAGLDTSSPTSLSFHVMGAKVQLFAPVFFRECGRVVLSKVCNMLGRRVSLQTSSGLTA